MPLRTKRWNDPVKKDDGIRVLVCRYRPRALPKKDENWHIWRAFLGPSKELHADFYGKGERDSISWDEYRTRYLQEMQGEEQQEEISILAELVGEGKTITLLCSSACEDATHCHRTLLAGLIEEKLASGNGGGKAGPETV